MNALRHAGRLGLVLLLVATGCTHTDDGGGHSGPEWSYQGTTGPAHWGDLAESFRLAREGTRQSPIDLSTTAGADSSALSFHYQPFPLSMLNNGHTIQVNCGSGGWIELADERYELAQFHFHSPSEHTVNGSAFPMEIHLVHKNAAGQLAVVGLLVAEGASNSVLDVVWSHIPAQAGATQAVEGQSFDATELLPDDRQRNSYAGSLTTPPCSEGVQWSVVRAPIELSAEQIAAFRKIYHGNARPTQPLNDRPVHVGP